SNFRRRTASQTGVVRQRDPNRIADITDGTSNTMMVGEKRMNLAFMGQPQESDAVGYTCGWDLDTARTTDRPPRPDNLGSNDATNRFGSSHPGRFNVVLADGSVRPISYTIDRLIFRYLGNKSDGQVISASDL